MEIIARAQSTFGKRRFDGKPARNDLNAVDALPAGISIQ